MYLINGSHFKFLIVESRWYLAFINIFDCKPNQIAENEENQEMNNAIREGNENRDMNDQVREEDYKAGDIEEGIQPHEEAYSNSQDVTHRIKTLSKDCELIDLEANQDM